MTAASEQIAVSMNLESFVWVSFEQEPYYLGPLILGNSQMDLGRACFCRLGRSASRVFSAFELPAIAASPRVLHR